MQTMVERSVRKEVRLTPTEARRLERLASALGMSESEILRMGMDEADAGRRRLEARRKNWHLLVKMAEEIPGPDRPTRFTMQ